MLEVEGLTKYYGARRAVNQMSFRVEKGEIVGLLGLNGSGKTTVLRILAGDLLPTAGRVTIGGRDLLEDPLEVKKTLSFLPETPPLYDEMTVEGYLRFVGRLRGMEGRRLEARLPEIEERVAIGEVRDEIIGHLSFGFRHRVALAMALLHEPELLLLDEPGAGLDPLQIVEMRRLIRSLKGRQAVILSSHLLPEISQVCDRIIVIQDGGIVGEGTEETLARRLAGRIRVRLTVEGAWEEAEACLQGIAGVEMVERREEREGRVVISLGLSEDARAEVARSLVEHGLGVLEMARTDFDLEDLFLQLTRTGEDPS